MSVRKCGLSSDMLYVVKVISSAWHQQVAPRTILRQQINNQYHQMTTIGAPAAALPWCVYLLSEQLSIQKAQISTNWKEKTRKWQQMSVVQVDRCICVFKFPVLHKVCRSGSAFESNRFWASERHLRRPGQIRFRHPSVNTHPNPNQKRSWSFWLDRQEIWWLMAVGRNRSGLWRETCRDFKCNHEVVFKPLLEFPLKIISRSFPIRTYLIRRCLLLRLRLGLLLCSHHPVDALDWQVHLLFRVIVIKLT